MSGDRLARRAAVAPLLYWLVVVGGLLAAHRVLEHGATSAAAALWAGAILGTALGQLAAWKRLPIWAVTLFVPVLMVAAMQLGLALCLTAGVASPGADPWTELEVGVMAFVPAVACGYASLTERGGLFAFWFPTSLWALAILDGTDGSALGNLGSWLLLSVLAALFVAMLAAREARRLSLWQRHAGVRLAAPLGTTPLRRSPARSLSQAAWMAAMAGATLALTAWVAPHLWQDEPTAQHLAKAAQAASGQAGGAPCCPDAPDEDGEGHRLKEYFPLLHPHDAPAPAPLACVACVGGVPVGSAPQASLSSLSGGDGGGGAATPPVAGAAAGGGDGSSLLPTTASPAAIPPAPPHAPPPPPALAPTPAAPAPPPAHPAPLAPTHAPPPAPLAAAPLPVAALTAHPLPWLLALAVSALLVQLALRPLRRAVTVRHLREPVFPEAVDQRVSNLWQLVLVGLRDAGWHPAPGEPPLALARRAALPGAETCALVLDRTRHGVRLDAMDVDAMRDAARTAYRAARARAGRLARALSWLRWPLV